ncbi:MAG: cell surface protein, partial [Christensenellaceae bacterium]
MAIEGMPTPQEEKVMLPDAQKIKAMLDKLAEYQYKTIQNPSVGTTGGEWAVLALARYGAISENFKQTYLGNLYGVLEKTKGVLDKRKYTEYSRVTLALSSLGMNAHEVAG